MPRVLAVSLNPVRTFGKTPRDEIRLVADYGVEGDTHAGATLKTHNGMIEVNQRQVHLIANELLEEMAMLNKTGPGPKVRTGVLGVVVTGGIVRAGDAVEVELPLVPHLPMKPM